LQGIRNAVQPLPEWGPANPEDRTGIYGKDNPGFTFDSYEDIPMPTYVPTVSSDVMTNEKRAEVSPPFSGSDGVPLPAYNSRPTMSEEKVRL
jgi:hypothetical protein